MGILSERIEHQIPTHLEDILYYYSASLSIISIVPNLLIIFHFFITKYNRNNIIYVFQLAISSILHSVSFIIPNKLCKIQGFLNLTFELSSILWTTSISFFINTIYHNTFTTQKEKNKSMVVVSLFAWIIPIIIGIIPLIIDDFTIDKGIMCWLNNNALTIAYCIYVLLIMAENFYLMIKLMIEIKRELKHDATLNQTLHSLSRYVTIQLVVYAPFIAEQMFGLFQGIDTYTVSFGWVLLREGIDSLSGALFAFCYGFSSQMLKETKEAILCSKSYVAIRTRTTSFLEDGDNGKNDPNDSMNSSNFSKG